MSKFSLHNTVNRSAVNKSKIATYSCLKLSLLQSEYLTFFFSKKGEICQIYLPPPPHLFHLYWLLPPHTLHLFTSHLWDINSHHQLQVCAKYPLCFLFYYFLIPDNLDLPTTHQIIRLGPRSCPGCFMACLTNTHGEWNLRSRSPFCKIILLEPGLALDALWHALPMGNGTWDLGVLSVKLSSWN